MPQGAETGSCRSIEHEVSASRPAWRSIDKQSYGTWEQVAGYFDGDGSVTVVVGKFTIAFFLEWSDQDQDQLRQLAAFIECQNLTTGTVRKTSGSVAYCLRISEQETAIKVAERLQPLCFKKKDELTTMIDYRKNDLISGSEVQRRLEQLVALGHRERHGNRRFVPMPWAYSVGYHLSRRNTALLSHRPHPLLSEAQKKDAQERHKVFGLTVRELSKRYGVSRSAMGRVLKDD